MDAQGMIERVAQAISMKLYGGYPVGEVSDRAIMVQWEKTKEVAREAIRAMRTPSKAMLDAVEAEEEKRGYVASAYETMDAETAWPIMIDAALNEQEKG